MSTNPDAEAAKDRGNDAIKSHNFDEAVSCYSVAISLAPNNATYYSNRAAAYIALKKWEDALKDADKAIELDPNFARGYQRKGQALQGKEEWLEAIQALQKASALDPNNSQIQKLVSDAVQKAQTSTYHQAQLKQIQALKEIFTDPVALCKSYAETADLADDPDFVKKLNEIRKDINNFEMYSSDENIQMFVAIAMKKRMLEKMSPQERDAAMRREQEIREKMLREEEQERDRKRKLEKERKEREAKEQAEREAAKRTPEQTQALLLKEKANDMYKLKRFEEAIALYDEALSLDPNNILFINNKAACSFEMGDIKKARELSEEAVEIGREHRADFALIGRAITRIGNTYMKEEDYEKAIEYFKKSLIDCRNAVTLNLLKKAEKCLEEKKAREYYSPELSTKAREEGNELFKQHKVPEAIRCYTEAIKRQPDNHVNYSNRSSAYIKLMALPEALKDADKCIELAPTFVKGYLRKGTCHMLLKENQKALEAFDKGLKLDPNNAEIKASIQKVMVQVGQGQDEETVRKNVERDPELQAILRDPVMQQVLQDLKTDPTSAQRHLNNPQIRANIDKLIAAGIISTR